MRFSFLSRKTYFKKKAYCYYFNRGFLFVFNMSICKNQTKEIYQFENLSKKIKDMQILYRILYYLAS